jgi:hypothetical protein
MGLASVLFITFFFLKERNLFMTSAKKLIPDGHEDKALIFRKKSLLIITLLHWFITVQLFIVFVLYFG